MTDVPRIVALGGSICRILRGLEAPGGPTSNQVVSAGGCLLKNLRSLIWEIEAWSFGRLEVTNVSRIVALGGSICRILRGLEAPGGPASNEAVAGSGSA